jgi:hypothetical protein
MQELLEKRIEIIRNPVKEMASSQNISKYSPNSYNLKEQLDQLIGPTNFNYKLEKVNLTIGIIVSSMLLLFFFI